MNADRKTLKLRARRALLGRYPAAVGILLITGIMTACIMFLTQISMGLAWCVAAVQAGAKGGFLVIMATLFLGIVIVSLFLWVLIPGMARFYLNLCQGRKAGVLDMLWAVRYHGGKFFGISLLIHVLTAVLALPDLTLIAAVFLTGRWEFPLLFLLAYNLLLGAAGVYIALNYHLAFLILADEPKWSFMDALRISRRLMKGNKRRFFMLSLSFLGWLCVAHLTFGLGLLWLIPYINCTFCFFYLDVKEKYRA